MKDAQTKRNQMYKTLQSDPPDIVIAGGGVTGAGIAREAALSGLRVLLVESMDFGWGSSSASSKLVHGGLRYLQSGQPLVTYHSVREREGLMNELPGLVRPLDFVLPFYSTKNQWLYKFGLLVYDRFAGRSYHHKLSANEVIDQFEGMQKEGLKGGYVYYDAQTDDMRLLLRIVHDADRAGATLINYARLNKVKFENDTVSAAVIYDRLTETEYVIPCKVVVNATGANADELRSMVAKTKLIRPLRGSHVVFSHDRLPISKAFAFRHPKDRRNVFVLPWLGVSFVGTTDLDHQGSSDDLAVISEAEKSYLLEAANTAFPDAKLQEKDIVSTWSGVRPVVSSGAKDPSKESRDMFIDLHKGLLTVTGGKLTTFRSEAIHALRKLSHIFASLKDVKPHRFKNPALTKRLGFKNGIDENYLSSAYSDDAFAFAKKLLNHDDDFFAGTVVLKEAARYALSKEWVVHLDDLMIRRLRLGLLLPNGGRSVLHEIRQMCKEAGWSDKYYKAEEERYLQMIRDCYS